MTGEENKVPVPINLHALAGLVKELLVKLKKAEDENVESRDMIGQQQKQIEGFEGGQILLEASAAV